MVNNDILRADDEDYIEIQGGRPSITKIGKITIHTHNYEGGDGMVVPSHVNHGTVILDTSRGTRVFNVDELRELHGIPCETRSKQRGGKGYQRKESE